MTDPNGERPEMHAYLSATRALHFHRERARKLVEALRETLDEARDMLPYVPEYFRKKWEYDATLGRLRASLDELSDDRVPPAAKPEPEPESVEFVELGGPASDDHDPLITVERP